MCFSALPFLSVLYTVPDKKTYYFIRYKAFIG